MKGKIFKIIVLACIFAVIAIVYALKQYNKPHTNIRTSKPEMLMLSGSLIEAFEIDEGKATQLYTGKIIQISGTIFAVNTKDGNNIITFQDQVSQASVICHFDSEEALSLFNLEKGQKATIKGECSGFLLDVIMIRCVLINERNE